MKRLHNQIADLEAIQSRPRRTLSNPEIISIRADNRNYMFLVGISCESIGKVKENGAAVALAYYTQRATVRLNSRLPPHSCVSKIVGKGTILISEVVPFRSWRKPTTFGLMIKA
jgi:hypothetical protein